MKKQEIRIVVYDTIQNGSRPRITVVFGIDDLWKAKMIAREIVEIDDVELTEVESDGVIVAEYNRPARVLGRN